MRAAAANSRRALDAEHGIPRAHHHKRCDGYCDAARQHRINECAKAVIAVFSQKRRLGLLALLLAICALMMFPVAAFASGNNVGQNVANLLKGYATELYGGIVGVVSLMFLVNRRYTELAVFLFAAIVVAWMVFASADIATAAEAIGKQIFG
jgi:hypothetical protein